ncbi:MAG: NapC/NirT family cytochrome c [Candidatus Aquicultorales bacterium]
MLNKVLQTLNPSHAIEVLRQPKSHPKEFALLVSIAVLMVFAFLVVFALTFVMKKREKNRESGHYIRPLTVKELGVILGVVGWFMVLSFSASYVLVASPTFCLACHGSSRVAQDLKSSVHKKLACQNCHQTPGLVGSVAYRLEIGRMVVGQIRGLNEQAAGSASRDACLHCHEKVIKKTIVAKSIRMEHRRPIEQGYRCEQCHFRIAHNEQKRSVAMSVCYDCHGKDKPLECKACHVNWAGGTNYSLIGYAKVSLNSDIDCRKCHDPKKDCLSCHDLAMPHSKEWNESGHSLRAVTDRKLCDTCHTLGECVKCHPGLPGPHQIGWKHGPSSKQSKASCINCHQVRYCFSCHTDLTNYKLKMMPDS